MQVSLVRLCFWMVVLVTASAEDDTDRLTTITSDEPIAAETPASPASLAPSEAPSEAHVVVPSEAPSEASSEAPSEAPSGVSLVAPSEAPIRQHAFLDGNTLLPLLLVSGGPPGEFPIENDQKRTSDDNCSAWIYEYTSAFPDGVLRHEHAVYDEVKLQRQARGVYAKMQPAGKPSFAIEYDKNNGFLNITATSKCNTTEWSVMICQQSNGLYKDYVVHGHHDPPCRDVPLIPPPTSLGNGSTLEKLVGIESLKKGDLPEDYDLSPLLMHFGGAPGEVVSVWNRNFTPLEAPADPKERPLADVKRTSWLYDYRAVNSPHSVRFEHASLRFKGQPDEFVDVRGVIYWRTSKGDFRIEYLQDDVGLRSKLDLAECVPIRGLWACTYSTKNDDA